MPHHIFFSWQSDTSTLNGRNLIDRALERAIGVLAADADIDPAVRELAVDRDSAGVPGSPPLVETIFNKIDRAAVFLSDLTYVAARRCMTRAKRQRPTKDGRSDQLSQMSPPDRNYRSIIRIQIVGPDAGPTSPSNEGVDRIE